MRAPVVVQDQAGFDRWAERVKAGREPQAGGVVPQQGSGGQP